MRLKLFPQIVTLCKLRQSADIGDWQNDLNVGPLNVSINDPHGCTVICSETAAAKHESDIVDRSDWRCIQIDEVFDVDSIGVVAEFSKLLADKQVSLFVISSYETDYLLVQPKAIDLAVTIFREAGHKVSSAE